MRFERAGTVEVDLDPQLQWLWHSRRTDRFILGDGRRAFAIPSSDPAAAEPLGGGEGEPELPCNLPIPGALLEEFLESTLHGFRFLDRAAYARAVDGKGEPAGDLLRTLVFGPDYGLFLVHPAGGNVLAPKSGSLELLERTGEGFRRVGATRTRGRAALAFAAHPSEPLIAYGDNDGAFHAHRFDAAGFGKATKIAAKGRKASRLEFLGGGEELVIGGMGYLATFTYGGGKFVPAREVTTPVRDFLLLAGGKVILVNGGLHGISAFERRPEGFARIGELATDDAIQAMAVSDPPTHLAVTIQGKPGAAIHAIVD